MGVILNGLKQVLILALSILPDSPVRGFLDNMAQLPYLGYINWLIPISDFLYLLSYNTPVVSLFCSLPTNQKIV